MPTYAIGDLQGCFDALTALLNKISFSPIQDTLWFTGDLINRGPDSLATLRFIYQLHQQNSAITVLGNHDLALLAVAFANRNPHPKDTYHDILAAPDRDELLHWLRQQPLLYTDKKLDYSLVHAGIPPQWTLAEAQRCANEVSTLLSGSNYQQFLENMFGNEPADWEDTLTGHLRARYITNALTRMRFCSDKGQLDLKTNGPAKSAPANLKPWYDWPSKVSTQTKILFGHWAALEGQCSAPNIYALDTGCIWGGCLTAFCLETQSRFNVKC